MKPITDLKECGWRFWRTVFEALNAGPGEPSGWICALDHEPCGRTEASPPRTPDECPDMLRCKDLCPECFYGGRIVQVYRGLGACNPKDAPYPKDLLYCPECRATWTAAEFLRAHLGTMADLESDRAYTLSRILTPAGGAG